MENAYPQFKNETNRQQAIANAEKYGLFTIASGLGKWSIATVDYIFPDVIVYFFHETELIPNEHFMNSVVGSRFKLLGHNILPFDNSDMIMSNKENFITAITEILNL